MTGSNLILAKTPPNFALAITGGDVYVIRETKLWIVPKSVVLLFQHLIVLDLLTMINNLINTVMQLET